jgi:hypothetical protein
MTMPTIPIPEALSRPLLFLIALIVVAVSVAVYAWLGSRQRREVLLRVEGASTQALPTPLLASPKKSLGSRIGRQSPGPTVAARTTS